MSHASAPAVIAVVGPTGTGKSDLSIHLAQQLGGEVINADSMQFYRGMDVGTAKLPVAERGGIPHHLLDFLDVTEEASVADFQRRARAAIADIQGRGLHPIVVGGSGLYVRAALDVLDLPPTDPAVRARLEQRAEQDGEAALRAELAVGDPESAARVKDLRRVIRALEVLETSGRPFSSYMPEREYLQPTIQLGLNGDRAVLHERLAARVTAMYRRGFVAEVQRLIPLGLRHGKTAQRALGYQQILRHLDDTEYTLAQAHEDTVVATRKFARRQITWFSADPRLRWFDFAEPDLAEQALEAVRRV